MNNYIHQFSINFNDPSAIKILEKLIDVCRISQNSTENQLSQEEIQKIKKAETFEKSSVDFSTDYIKSIRRCGGANEYIYKLVHWSKEKWGLSEISYEEARNFLLKAGVILSKSSISSAVYRLVAEKKLKRTKPGCFTLDK